MPRCRGREAQSPPRSSRDDEPGALGSQAEGQRLGLHQERPEGLGPGAPGELGLRWTSKGKLVVTSSMGDGNRWALSRVHEDRCVGPG